jgi:hypothetical protein
MSQDKDELAKLLGELAAGEHTDEEAADQIDDDDQVGPLAEPAPPPPTQAPMPKAIPPAPIAKIEPRIPPTPPRPALKPPTPKPVVPVPKSAAPATPAATPLRPPVKPALPPRPAPVVQPMAPAPAPKPAARPTPKPLLPPRPTPTPIPTPIPESPAASTPIIADEEEPERYSGTDDDAVIVPAMAPTELARPHAPLPRRKHLSQKLYFKQTIIPILLTLGLICLLIPVCGLVSSQYSPFKALAESYFMATFWPLGLAFLVFGFLTMFSVKKELEPRTPTVSE